MDDTIEVCSGCGKMPRTFDREGGSFVCSRCGNRTTIQVSADNYEKVVSELDQKFHESILKMKAESVSHEPIVMNKAAPKKKAAIPKKSKPAKKAPAKKSAKKK
jgi:recombinational DNA repair protein (RecF pathway)